jgi:CHAD domain-containing protein
MAKAKKIPNFNPDLGLDKCLPKILNTRLNEMLSYEKGTIEGKNIEFLHNMRVSSRRLQAVLKAFRKFYPQNKFKKEYGQLRSLIRALGIVRHYDVFIDLLEKYNDTLEPKLKSSMEFLIIQQKSHRTQKRIELVNMVKLLKRSRFNENFREFISSKL